MIWFYLGIIVFGGLMFLLMRLPTTSKGKLDLNLVKRRWSEVEEGVKKSGAGRKQAVIEADKLLDYVLKQQGYNGQTMAERLKKAENTLHDKEAVWQAHKLRNRLVHETDADLMGDMGKRDVAAIKQAINDLGVKV
ncbi:MAG: hypothetical protein WDZ81_00785 [Candidatus Saccharimonadales bacterium]